MEKIADNSNRYMKNPDVVVREEDEDGALIFNPDTNQISVINPTALFIWKLCNGENTKTDIVSVVRESFDLVPEDEVEQQVEGFVDGMLASGFIGTIEDEV